MTCKFGYKCLRNACVPNDSCQFQTDCNFKQKCQSNKCVP